MSDDSIVAHRIAALEKKFATFYSVMIKVRNQPMRQSGRSYYIIFKLISTAKRHEGER